MDSAIAEVASEKYKRLSEELSLIAMPRITDYALRQLKGLQSGVMPNYDQWVAPFYLSWYQPGQINLAYSMITAMANAKGVFTETGKLHVVDFENGALVMQFGVALAAADAIRDGQTIDEILIDSLDSSTAMINIGMKLWERFKMKVKEDPNLAVTRSSL